MEIKNLPQSLYCIIGKADQDGAQKWLPLWMHAADTAGVLEWLADNWLSDAVWECLQNSGRERKLERCELKQLICFLGYVHDIGKVTPYFTSLIGKKIPDAINRLKENGISILSWNQYKTSGCNHALMSEIFLLEYCCPRGVASIVGTHHGMTHKVNSNMVKTKLCPDGFLKNNLYGDNIKQWMELRHDFFDWALCQSGYRNISEIPELLQKGQVLLTGLLIMADWIASNQAYFPLLALEEMGNKTMYPERVDYAMNKLVKLPGPWKSITNTMDEESFKHYFGFLPRPAQLDFVQTIQNIKDMETYRPGIFILEAPMGMGKTEAAFAGAQLLANWTLAGGIFFGLPTQATANSIFKRLIPWADILAKEGQKLSVRLAHAMTNLDDDWKGLEGSSQVDDEADDEPESGKLYLNTWFSGKKQALLADFVVGTIDQILMSSLKRKHVMLRHLGMAGKIVILDECHAYDVYTSTYLDRTLTWMGAYGQPVIILSATLPAGRRRELVAAYLNKQIENIPKEIETSMGYPLLTYSVGEMVLQKELQSDNVQTLVSIESLDFEKLVEFLKTELRDGGCAAIILNTVRQVQQTARLLRDKLQDKEIFEFHSRYLYSDRKEREKELLRRMGKESTAKERDGFILVASQVAEQSLDFDADILITELCPMDLLLQRLGREHRHKQHDLMRPANLLSPRCMILREGGKAYSNGTKAVYEECLLMRTQEILPDKIRIPADIPTLVQKVYVEDDSRFENIVGYKKAKEKYQNDQETKKSKARNYLLPKPSKSEERRESVLDQLLSNAVQGDDREAEASVRDGGASLEVLVLQKQNDKITFLPWLDKGEVLNWKECLSSEIYKKIARQRLRLPASLCRGDRIENVIKELKAQSDKYFKVWKESSWINGELLLLLDENLSATLDGVQLNYSRDDGLMEKTEKEEKKEWMEQILIC